MYLAAGGRRVSESPVGGKSLGGGARPSLPWEREPEGCMVSKTEIAGTTVGSPVEGLPDCRIDRRAGAARVTFSRSRRDLHRGGPQRGCLDLWFIEAVADNVERDAAVVPTVMHDQSSLWYMVLVEERRRHRTLPDERSPGEMGRHHSTGDNLGRRMRTRIYCGPRERERRGFSPARFRDNPGRRGYPVPARPSRRGARIVIPR